MSGMEKFSTKELEAELKKRRMDEVGPWPKVFEITAEIDIDTRGSELECLLDNLEYEYDLDKDEFMDSFYNSIDPSQKIEFEVNADGTARIVKFGKLTLSDKVLK